MTYASGRAGGGRPKWFGGVCVLISTTAVLLTGCDRPVSEAAVPPGEVTLASRNLAPIDTILPTNDLIGPTGGDISTDCTATSCDDGNPCNGKETCNLNTGSCTSGKIPVAGTSCGDGNMCNGAEACDGAGACVGSRALVCNDGKPCTTDSCAPATGCVHTPVAVGTACSDGNLCNGAETCDSAGVCQPGTALACNDDNVCTDDVCNAATGCAHTYNTAGCDDANACTYGERCVQGACGGGTQVVCMDDPCNQRTCNGTANCDSTPKTNAPCDDGAACTHSDRCNGQGRCAGTALSCESDARTIRSCNGAAMCDETVRTGAACDDGNPCTKDDAIRADGVCGGTAYACAVGVCLTANACDGKGGCRPTPMKDGAPCDADQNKCTPRDTCKAGVCTPDPTPVACVPRDCNTAACDPTTGNCQYTATSGGECGVTGCFSRGMCKAGACSGVPKDCSAFSSSCGEGVCSSETGKCVSAPKPNGTSCATAAKCAVGAACVYGSCELAPMVCPVATGACKMPTCDVATGQCTEMNRPAGSACDPQNSCLVAGHCTADGRCVGAPAPNGDPCTTAEGQLGLCALGLCLPAGDDGSGRGNDAAAPGGTRKDGGAVDAPAGTGGGGAAKGSGGGGCSMARTGGSSLLATLLIAVAMLLVRRRRRARAAFISG